MTKKNAVSDGITRRAALAIAGVVPVAHGMQSTPRPIPPLAEPVGDRWTRARGISPTDFLPDTPPSAAQFTAALQQAIDRSTTGEVYIPAGIWPVEPQGHPALPGTFGTNSVCIRPKSNLHLHGPGTLRLADSKGGGSGAIIGNWDGKPIENVRIACQIDGNATAAGGTMSGIVLVNARDCTIAGGAIRNMSFNGVQIARSSTGCSVDGMRFDQIGYIGIQLQHAANAIISNNNLTDIGNNAIDLESNNQVQGQNVISNNICSGCASFVFLESGGNSIVSENNANNIEEAGVWLNRINTGSENNIIVNNKFQKGSRSGKLGGIYCNNSSGRSIIANNMIDGFEYGMNFDGRSHYLAVEQNYFRNIGKFLYNIPAENSALVKSVIRQPYYEGPLQGRLPYTAPPLDNPSNRADRAFHVAVASMWNMDEGSARAETSDAEYRTGAAGTLTIDPAWNGQCSRRVGGETLVRHAGGTMTVGRYVRIDTSVYYVQASRGPGIAVLRDANRTSGDFTAAFQPDMAWQEYWPEWQTG
ncbi:right-handed parallel beta-helix repeat-containing protein [Sphingomonas paucimobilis]|uniref:right-handed parallel beta-helix repeat-containing protein n=1 Tax=Sphingomonas paucimobilis TaxID=13689 RepID=UPI00064C1461|nr:right-handed parallel beta-helix repeat-containing protein [Sphingomonas paucimobilis]